MRKAAIWAGLALAIAAPVLAADALRTERLRFAPGASAITVQGAIRGDEAVNYLVAVRAGQTLTVGLHTDNRANSFVILAPGARDAMFVGSVSGNAFRGKVLTGGDYTVQVHLSREAARRGATANYRLGVALTD